VGLVSQRRRHLRLRRRLRHHPTRAAERRLLRLRRRLGRAGHVGVREPRRPLLLPQPRLPFGVPARLRRERRRLRLLRRLGRARQRRGVRQQLRGGGRVGARRGAGARGERERGPPDGLQVGRGGVGDQGDVGERARPAAGSGRREEEGGRRHRGGEEGGRGARARSLASPPPPSPLHTGPSPALALPRPPSLPRLLSRARAAGRPRLPSCASCVCANRRRRRACCARST
jgi:hypothetical protein